MTDDYDPAKDAHDSYYAAVEAKRKRRDLVDRLFAIDVDEEFTNLGWEERDFMVALQVKLKDTADDLEKAQRADSEYESVCDDLKAAEARVAEFRAALAEILALDSTRSIWDARGIARSALMHGLMMRHPDIAT